MLSQIDKFSYFGIDRVFIFTMDIIVMFSLFYVAFSLIANLAWYCTQESLYDTPDVFTDIVDIFTDIRRSKIFNPFVIVLATFGIFMRNLPEFLYHILLWWFIIPKRMMEKKNE